MTDTPAERGAAPRNSTAAQAAPRGAAALALALLAVTAGCAVYHARPLSQQAPPPLADIKVPAGTLLPGGLKTHTFDPSDGLDATEVAMLAVVQSPELKVRRAAAGVSHAQAFAAGLLPDPVLGYSEDRPQSGQPGASTAYTKGVSWDVSNLLTLAARRSAKRRTDEAVDLNLLWDEWQTVAEARLGFVRVQSGRALVERVATEAQAIAPLAPHLQAALKRGAVSYDVAETGLTAASDVERQLAEARSELASREQDLRDLLGLPADEPLPLVGALDLTPLSEQAVAAALNDLPHRRPDLRALEVGYAAQEARVRGAILGQFPAINVGVNRSKDNTGISSSGFALSISLPLFDGNRGNVRIERATREQLHVEYEQRLLTARADVSRLLNAQRILEAEEAELGPHAVQLNESVSRGARAYASGAMEWTTYLALRQSALAADVALNALRQTLSETRIQLATLLAGDWTQDSGSS